MRFLLLLIPLLISSFVYADTLTFRQAKKELVQLYKERPEVPTFYCGCDIGWQGNKGIPKPESCGYEPRKPITRSGQPNQRATRVEWEHVVPAHWFGHQLQCWQEGGRKNCKKDPRFVEMEGDMRNLQPAIGELNGDRSNYRFAMLEGEKRSYGACDFEVDFKRRKVEPSPEVRGDIARTYFYMSEKYGIALSKQQTKLFNVWNKSDQIDEWEIQRNKSISGIQSNVR